MGRYVESNLVKDEKRELETTYHLTIFYNRRTIHSLVIEPLIHNDTDEFAITNKRGSIKTGLISRKTFEMNHSKIESINVDQGIIGRMLGYGSIKISGSGGTKESFLNILNPLEFRKKFQEFSI